MSYPLPPSGPSSECRVGVGWDGDTRLTPLGDDLNLQVSVPLLLLSCWCRLGTVLPGMGHKDLGCHTRRGALT